MIRPAPARRPQGRCRSTGAPDRVEQHHAADGRRRASCRRASPRRRHSPRTPSARTGQAVALQDQLGDLGDDGLVEARSSADRRSAAISPIATASPWSSVAVAGRGLDAVPDGVAEVQHRAQAALGRILAHDARLVGRREPHELRAGVELARAGLPSRARAPTAARRPAAPSSPPPRTPPPTPAPAASRARPGRRPRPRAGGTRRRRSSPPRRSRSCRRSPRPPARPAWSARRSTPARAGTWPRRSRPRP